MIPTSSIPRCSILGGPSSLSPRPEKTESVKLKYGKIDLNQETVKTVKFMSESYLYSHEAILSCFELDFSLE